MLWVRAFVIWVIIIAVESVNGALRTMLLVPVVGDLTARQIGLPVGAALILLVSILTARWLAASSVAQCLAVGALWIILTFGFEVGLGLALGLSPQRIAADYNPAAGGFMAFGLIFMGLCPLIAARARKTIKQTSDPSDAGGQAAT